MHQKNGRVISSKKVYSNEYLHIYEDKFDLNGIEKIYIRGIRKDYSTIVPFVSKDEILIIKSYRHLVDSIEIEVPSGYIDEGETAKQAAIRELKKKQDIRPKILFQLVVIHWTIQCSNKKAIFSLHMIWIKKKSNH